MPVVTQHFAFYFFCFFVYASSAPVYLHPDAEDTAVAAWTSSQDERESGSSATSQQRGSFPCFALWGLLECAAELCRCIEKVVVVGGGSLRMTGFVQVFETNNQRSCLCTNFCGRVGRCPSELWTDSVTWSRIWTSLEPLFPLAPAAARTPGKTGTVRPTKKKEREERRSVSECSICAYV